MSCKRTCPPLDAMALCEAVCAITSSVLLWIGAGDLIELLVPNTWPSKLLMVVLGTLGLFLTRTLYEDRSLACMGERGGEQQDVAMLEAAEPPSSAHGSASPSPTNGAAAPLPDSPVSSSRHSVRAERGDDGLPSLGPPATLCTDVADDPGRRRLYFDTPKLDRRRCGMALGALLMGLMVWVGIWDLVDELLVPALSNACSGTPQPGPMAVVHAPGCIGIKLLLLLLGAAGLWCTRGLYGSSSTRQPAQFQRVK